MQCERKESMMKIKHKYDKHESMRNKVWGYRKKIMVLYKRHDPIMILKWEHEQVIKFVVICYELIVDWRKAT